MRDTGQGDTSRDRGQLRLGGTQGKGETSRDRGQLRLGGTQGMGETSRDRGQLKFAGMGKPIRAVGRMWAAEFVTTTPKISFMTEHWQTVDSCSS